MIVARLLAGKTSILRRTMRLPAMFCTETKPSESLDIDQSEDERVIPTKLVKINENLTPFQKWCIDGGIERPYTGDLWYERGVGTYSCVNCNTELFR